MNTVSLDTEVNGLDHFHGAEAYLVTFGLDGGGNSWCEWDVDPETRKVLTSLPDLDGVQQTVDDADQIVLQNSKYDVCALRNAFNGELRWDWGKVHDTLTAGHLLASNHPHDLTAMCVEWMGVNIQKWEDRLKAATVEALRIVRREFPAWRLAKRGLPEMPSAKGEDKEKQAKGAEKSSRWKMDAFIPRALVKQAVMSLAFGLLPDADGLPTVVKSVEQHDVDISRPGKWGNPFVIGKDGDREDVVRRYAAHVWNDSELLASLPELRGKRLGCRGNCAPDLCHGHVLRALCHPWRVVLADYANVDSASTLALWQVQEQLLKDRGLWNLYLEKVKTLRFVEQMERRGATIHVPRSVEHRERCRQQADDAGRTMVAMAAERGHELELPKGAAPNNSLRTFCFDVLDLPRVYDPKGKSGEPTMGKLAAEEWSLLPPGPQRDFTRTLALRSKRSTQVTYAEGYERYWVAPGNGRLAGDDRGEWRVLHGNLNPTGTDTLRFSHSAPNLGNVSKQNITCFFCDGDGCGECGGRGTERQNLRHPFGPAPGREWWCADFENIELRIPGYEAEERKMIELFERPDEPPYFGSYHLLNASIIFPDEFWPLTEEKGAFKEEYKDTCYQWTKNFGFAKQYNCGEATGDRAAHKRGAFMAVERTLSAVSRLNERYIANANRFGYVETLPDKTVDPTRGYPLLCVRGERGTVKPTEPLCYHVSGTAMWCTIKAMNRCGPQLEQWRDGGFDAWMVLQVHDELVFDFPKGPKMANKKRALALKRLMEESGADVGIPTPVSLSYHAESWAEGVAVAA